MSKKTEKKKQEKVIEDRTFGLKNKNKSKTVQKFIKGVEHTVKNNGLAVSKIEAEQFQRKKLRRKEEEEKALLNSLFKDVNRLKEDQDQDQDPANTVCPYFKQGLCQKGKKCIYSHDLTLDRTEQIDLYTDQRTQLIMNAIGGKELGQLSQEELGKLIGEKEKQMMKGFQSNIVCKFFLQAAQKQKYGWNWSCPNGGDRCKYKHCLPPGYRLKKDQGKVEIDKGNVNIQQKIDQERNNLLAQNKTSSLVTLEVFLKWKEDRKKRKEADFKKKKEDEEKKTKHKGQLKTGKELFTYDPTLFVDDEEAADQYEQQQIEEEPEEQKIQKIQDQEQELQKQEKTEETGAFEEQGPHQG